MNGEDGLHRLELHEDLVIDDEVDAITCIDARSFIVNGNGNLAIDMETPLPELPAKAGAVCGLEQSRPEMPMNLDSASNDLSGERISLHFAHSFLPMNVLRRDSHPRERITYTYPRQSNRNSASRSLRSLRLCGSIAVALLLTSARTLSSQEPARAVILPDSTMPHILTQCSREIPSGIAGFWRPRPTEMLAAEEALDRALVRALDSVIASDSTVFANMRDLPRTTWPDAYFRQYAGLRYRDGRRTIYINAFSIGWPRELSERVAESDPANPLANADWWRVSAASICKGGALYFGAEYDPSSGRIVALRFNSAQPR